MSAILALLALTAEDALDQPVSPAEFMQAASLLSPFPAASYLAGELRLG